MSSNDTKIRASHFYSEYFGHKVEHLAQILPHLRETTDRLVWTAGDSSLDNKYWFRDRGAAPAAYHDILEPPQCKKDVTYWLNYFLCQEEIENTSSSTSTWRHRPRTAAINAAVEATTLNERTFRLRPQDVFIRDNIQRDDVLVVSVGGNDVALMPLPCTIASILGLVLCTPKVCIDKSCAAGTVPVDDCCCGCGASLLSCACAFPPCLGYTRHMFGTRVQKYIERLVAKTKPRKILVCMIYYPDERKTPAWAGAALGALGYNRDPERLQLLIRKTFDEGVSRIHIDGSQVIPVPLFRVLDGKVSSDYVQRVEPSPTGGRKMAEFILDMMDQHPSNDNSHVYGATDPAAPGTAYMQDRG
eukprot:scaffold310_cov168-Amphora_coffeaeformis.AAC.51